MMELSSETIRDMMARQRKMSHSLRPGFHSGSVFGEVVIVALVVGSSEAMAWDVSLTEFDSAIFASRVIDLEQRSSNLRFEARCWERLSFI